MTLLYLYFENDLPLDGTYKGIKPDLNGYSFDNRFNIKLDNDKKIFYIENNPNFIQIYNEAISNFSCIVGKNGSGKTTFMELLISNIAWGITEKQPTLMKSLYYTNESGNFKFFLHQYVKWDEEYKIYYKKEEEFEEVEVHKHGYYKDSSVYGRKYSSLIPSETKFIFHSLSPFDKIFYSIAQPFSKYPKRIPPFMRQMKYIGNQNIFEGDPKHEIQTLTNLISLFSNKYFSEPFEESLNYKFSKIEININHRKKILTNNDKSYVSEIIKKLDTFENIENYPELVIFKKLEEDVKESFFSSILYPSNIRTSVEDFIFFLIMDNFILVNMTSNITYFNNFLKLISFSSSIENNQAINYETLKSNILEISSFPDYIFIENIDFINSIIDKKEELLKVLSLSFLPITDIKELDLAVLIKLIRKLKNHDYLEFKLFLLKGAKEINYFYLSSGEKTMISYFANLMASILDFDEPKNKTYIIMIDEIELHLHPEWQRNFIEYMNIFFRPNSYNMRYQFIIATHSPFVLSDIVEEQIIFINETKKEKDNNTFGANIYDIFEKGFFLENSIGLCSEKMIRELSNIIYLFKTLEYVLNDDYFLMRNFLEESYMINKNMPYDEIARFKEEENIKLGKLIVSALLNQNVSIVPKKISNKTIIQHVIADEGYISLNKKIEKYINIIGEPTIRIHLEELYSQLKEFKFNANDYL